MPALCAQNSCHSVCRYPVERSKLIGTAQIVNHFTIIYFCVWGQQGRPFHVPKKSPAEAGLYAFRKKSPAEAGLYAFRTSALALRIVLTSLLTTLAALLSALTGLLRLLAGVFLLAALLTTLLATLLLLVVLVLLAALFLIGVLLVHEILLGLRLPVFDNVCTTATFRERHVSFDTSSSPSTARQKSELN
jgi:hypothetical protein